MKYNCLSRTFHWVMAVLMIGMLAVGLYMSDLDFSDFKMSLYGYHKATGILILALVALRILWRFKHTPPALPADMKPYEKLLAKGAHYALYLAMIIMPLSGWGMSSAGGHPISFFGLFTVPPLVEKNKELGGFFHETHEIAGYAVIVLIAFHFAAALYHHFVRKDDVLKRMI